MGGGKGGGGRTKSADASIHPVNVSLGSLDSKRAPPRNKMAAFESSLMSGKKAMSPLSLSKTDEAATDVRKLPLMGGGNLVYNDGTGGVAQNSNLWRGGGAGGVGNSDSNNSSSSNFAFPLSMNMFSFGLLGLGSSAAAAAVAAAASGGGATTNSSSGGTHLNEDSFAKAEYSRQSTEKRRIRMQKRKERRHEGRTKREVGAETSNMSTSRGCGDGTNSVATSRDNGVADNATTTTTTTTASGRRREKSRSSYCSHSDGDENEEDEEMGHQHINDDHEGEVQDPYLHRLMISNLAIPSQPHPGKLALGEEQCKLALGKGDSHCSFQSSSPLSTWPEWNPDQKKHIRSIILNQEKSFKHQLEKLHQVNDQHVKNVHQYRKSKKKKPNDSNLSTTAKPKEDPPTKDDNTVAVPTASQPPSQLKHSHPPAEDSAVNGASAPTSTPPVLPADLVARWHMQTYGNTNLDFRNVFAPMQMSAFGSPNLSQFVSSRQQEGRSDNTNNINNSSNHRNKIGGGARSSLDPSQLSQFSSTSSMPAKSSNGAGSGNASATTATTTLMPKAKAATPESARDILKSLSHTISSSSSNGGGRDK